MSRAEERSQEHPATPTGYEPEAIRESTNSADSNQQPDPNGSNPDVVYEELLSSSEEVGVFNRHSAVRQSVRSDSGRNVHFTRQSSSTMSIRSDSRILGRQESIEREGFSRQRSENMSTRSERGRGRMQREATEPFFNFQVTDGFENSEHARMQPLSIHQVRTPSQQQRAQSATSPLGDIPGFNDPEILGGSDSLEKLKINLPPDIYSSQILRTVKSPEQAGDSERGTGDGDEEDPEFEESGSGRGGGGGMVITQCKQSAPSSDNLISLQPGEMTI